MAKTGRPTKYTEAIAAEICVRTACGEPLAYICRDESMPCVATVYNWERDHPEFLEARALSRKDQADTYADKIALLGHKVEAGELKPDAANSARNSYAWVAERANPTRYADRQHVEHSGQILAKIDIVQFDGK